jgi:hypothetical protein
MTGSILKKGVFAMLILAIVGGMTAMPVVAENSTINYSSSAAPQLEVVGDVTIADHRMGDSPLTYNSNNGEWVEHPGSVNSSIDNPYEFVASDVAFDDAGAFPHAVNASALNSTLWSTDASAGGSVTVDDVETAPGVDALSVSTSSQTDGDKVTATFDLTQSDVDAPITSDEEKRYLQLVGDVNTLDAGTTVEVRVNDSDGDYYHAEINTSRSSGEDYITNATGEGVIYQQQLGELEMTQNGDGTFNDIETVEVIVQDGNADVEISALNVDKMGAWDFGDERVDSDDDDDLETEQITEHKTGGALAISDLGSMGDTFADAHIKGLTVPFVMNAEDLDSEDTNATFTEATQYSNYESHFDGQFRFEVPNAYDLSHANLEFQDTVSVPGTRYVDVEYAEGTGDTEFDEISSWSDLTDSYDSVGANVTVDDTVQPGTAMVISYDYVITSDEQSDLQNTGGAVGPTGGSGGGILGMILSVPGVIVSGIAGFLGLRRKGWL